MSALKERYQKDIIPAMMKQFDYKNVMEVPRVEKVVINMGVGDAIQDSKFLDAACSGLALITGQRPIINRAKKSIAGFKLRKGMNIGCKITLRGERMYEFLYKLFNVALPRIRDFRGLSPKSFDGRGNYNIGIIEQIIFPEVEYDKVVKVRGMDITLVTTAKTDEEANALLQLMGMPLREAES